MPGNRFFNSSGKVQEVILDGAEFRSKGCLPSENTEDILYPYHDTACVEAGMMSPEDVAVYITFDNNDLTAWAINLIKFMKQE